ncbi:MAG: hypothetical protein ABSG21_11980 [Spirochaetia bacterium]
MGRKMTHQNSRTAQPKTSDEPSTDLPASVFVSTFRSRMVRCVHASIRMMTEGVVMRFWKSFFIFCALAVLVMATVSCGKKVPLAGDQKVFAGKWVAADGTFVVLYLDGSGDLNMSNTSVQGGTATIAGDVLTIGIGPIKKTMKITQQPKEENGGWTLGLDGNVYSRSPQ